jgi:hypothetical protein
MFRSARTKFFVFWFKIFNTQIPSRADLWGDRGTVPPFFQTLASQTRAREWTHTFTVPSIIFCSSLLFLKPEIRPWPFLIEHFVTYIPGFPLCLHEYSFEFIIMRQHLNNGNWEWPCNLGNKNLVAVIIIIYIYLCKTLHTHCT